MNKKNYKIVFPISGFSYLFFCILMLAVLSGCTMVKEQKKPEKTYKSQINLFLNGPDRALLDISFDISAIKVVADDGTKREVMNTSLSINSIAITGRQIFLGERTLPEGKYEKIELIVERASIKRKGREIDLMLPSDVIEIGSCGCNAEKVKLTSYSSCF